MKIKTSKVFADLDSDIIREVAWMAVDDMTGVWLTHYDAETQDWAAYDLVNDVIVWVNMNGKVRVRERNGYDGLWYTTPTRQPVRVLMYLKGKGFIKK